jgi:hypothetical protein
MKARHRILKLSAYLLGGILGLAGLLLLAAWLYVYHRSDLFPSRKHPLTAAEIAASAANKLSVDTAVSRLKSGQLVLRMGRGADSYLLSQFNTRDKSYSHCGVLFLEQGYPFVYHCIGGEDNPDERLRRDSASSFFSPKENLAIAIVDYGFDTAVTARLQHIVLNYYHQRPRFDLKFDLATDDELYCAEFVYKALNRAMNDSGFIRTTYLGGRTFVGVDALFNNGHSRIIWQSKFK